MKYTEVTATSPTASRHIHLYLAPSVHGPGCQASPAFQRYQIGMAKARYSPMTPIETTARKAVGAPVGLLYRAGRVSTRPATPLARTAFCGVPFAFTLAHNPDIGTAPSRLNANSMRE